MKEPGLGSEQPGQGGERGGDEQAHDFGQFGAVTRRRDQG
jgi:hypothetical protein